MSSLVHPRHERFAQALADGKSQEAAYVAAGYRPKGARANASKLLQREHSISRRIAELLDERKRITDEGLAVAVKNSGMDRTRIDTMLVEIVERCMQSRPVLDDDGQQVHQKSSGGAIAPLYTFDARGAIAALRLLGLERGMFRQRVEAESSLLEGLPADLLKKILDALVLARQQRSRNPPGTAK